MKVKNKTILFLSLFLFFSASVHASNINFSGGFTKVSLQDGNHTVTLSDPAKVDCEDVSISADTIDLYGTDYNYVRCTGNVVVREEQRNITMSCPMLVYNRSKEELLSDGWIEIDDTQHEVKLSGAWLEYDKDKGIMLLQMQATIEKDTEDGLMTCKADSIEYNSDNQTVTLKGSANVIWGDDTYKASIITVNLDTEEVILHGSISGEVNGKN